MNNMNLDCVGPLTCKWFSIINIIVPHCPWLVESLDGSRRLTISCKRIINTHTHTLMFKDQLLCHVAEW